MTSFCMIDFPPVSSFNLNSGVILSFHICFFVNTRIMEGVLDLLLLINIFLIKKDAGMWISCVGTWEAPTPFG
jgi:hypothetical protein